MMDIETLKTKKILGYVEYFMQEKKHAELIPIAYYDKNENCYVKLQESEIKLFTPYEKVFYPGIEYIGCTKENTLIEFSFKQAKEKGKDDYIVDHAEIKETLRRLKYIAPLESIHENYFSLDELKNTHEIFKEDEINFRFYFAIRRPNDEVWVYGAFKSENNRIVPEIGTEVIKYRFPKEQLDNISVKIGSEKRYLLETLAEYESEDSVDCSTHKQLNEWFKKEFSKILSFSDTDISVCKKLIEEIEDTKTYADQIRFTRVKKKLEILNWTKEEVENLLNSNSSIMTEIKEKFEEYKEEIVRENCEELDLLKQDLEEKLQNKEDEIIEKENIVALIQNNIKKKELELQNISENITAKQIELDTIHKNQDAIIENIKLYAPFFFSKF